jgi:flagellar biogenesis protein FliO
MYGALGLAAAGAGIWLLRRRRTRPGTPASIEIIAQRSLGGKARIVWLSAGPREMIVSVTAQQVRMLGQWPRTEVAAQLPVAHTHADPAEESRREPSFAATLGGFGPIDKPVSPAVTGLLRLRGRTGQMSAVTPEVATGDVEADELWAKEILAATTAHPGGRS